MGSRELLAGSDLFYRQSRIQFLPHEQDGLIDQILCILLLFINMFVREEKSGDQVIKTEIGISQVLFAIPHFQAAIDGIPELQPFFIVDDRLGPIERADPETAVESTQIPAAEVNPVDSPWIFFICPVTLLFFCGRQ